MKTLWIWISSFVAVIVIGIIVLYLSIIIAAWAFLPSYDEESVVESIFRETPVTEFELEAIKELETKEFLRTIETFWNEHGNCEYWKGNTK